MLSLPPLALYIHIPWCVRKCPYCDFNSHESAGPLPEADYLRALKQDLQSDLTGVQGRKLASIFIGGGTPSLVSPQVIAGILDTAEAAIGFAPDIEITMEANPGTFEQEKFRGFRAAGVNRLSLGIQSFHNRHLQRLGRIHDRANAIEAAGSARNAGFDNVNLDLMHGLPQQTPAQALADLQYEVSAYGRENRYSRHNLNYWQFGDYLGIGAGAHGKMTLADSGDIVRTSKTRNPGDYLDRTEGFLATRQQIDPGELPLEFMMNALRLVNGVPADFYARRTGLSFKGLAGHWRALQDRGLVEEPSETLVTTPLGFRFLNSVLETLSAP